MRAKTTGLSSLVLILVAPGLFAVSGCGRHVQALFTKPQLTSYERFAVMGLTPEQEQIFMAAYIKGFPEQPITFVERARLREIISEQDLLQGRLDERSRAKIQQILGVEALVMCAYYDSDVATKMKLRVRIVDASTGAIVGSAIVDSPDTFTEQCRTAVKALRSDLGL